jgi:hypothetical protein
MGPACAAPIPALQALLDALADRSDTTAAEVATVAIGRSTANKLRATLATQGRGLRRPSGYQGGRRTPPLDPHHHHGPGLYERVDGSPRHPGGRGRAVPAGRGAAGGWPAPRPGGSLCNGLRPSDQ